MVQNKTREDSDAYVEALKTIANSKRVKQLCEPHVMSHEDLKDHQITKILYARKLIGQELERK